MTDVKTTPHSRLFVITPARDEEMTLPLLAKALHNQTMPVNLWMVLENGSSDRTKSLLQEDLSRPSGAIQTVLSPPEADLSLPAEEAAHYVLGTKYARIIKAGIAIVQETIPDLQDNDFVAILDADTLPAHNYFAEILHAFHEDNRLGLASGTTVDCKTGLPTPHNPNWPRGACRVWRWRALRQSCIERGGYPVGPSADSLSAIKAQCAGWKSAVIPTAQCTMRQVGARVDAAYYGVSAYYRGETLLHAFLRALNYCRKREVRTAYAFLYGYVCHWLSRTEQTPDPEILSYSRTALWRRLKIKQKIV